MLVLPYILTALAVCFFVRLAPFVVFKDEESVPQVVKYIGKYLPPAIITGIVVYCLKYVDVTAFPYGAKEAAAVAVVVALHIWRRSSLLSVFAGTAFYMLLVQAL